MNITEVNYCPETGDKPQVDPRKEDGNMSDRSLKWSLRLTAEGDWDVLENAGAGSERIVCTCRDIEDANAIAETRNRSDPTATARRFAAAVAAMQGMLAGGYRVLDEAGTDSPLLIKRLAARSAVIADALLDALNLPSG